MTHFLQILLLICIVIFAAKMAGALSIRFGQPSVFGEILIGLILGPTVLNMMHWPLFQNIEFTGTLMKHFGSMGVKPEELLELVLKDMAEIGVILLMFVAGMETDMKEMRRVGKVAFWAACGGVVAPLLGALGVGAAFGHSIPQSWFIGAILTATSVSISAQTLMELRQLKSKEGSTILGAAVIDDVLGIIVLALVVAFELNTQSGIQVTGSGHVIQVVQIVGRMVIFFAVAIWLGYKFLDKITEKIIKLPVSQPLIGFVLIVIFFYAWAAEHLGGVAAITGSYIVGVLFAQTKFREKIDHGIHPITYSLFVPFFFISIGMEVNALQLGNDLGFLIAIIIAAVITKVFGCWMGAKLTGFTGTESLRVGVGMISRGEVGLIVAGVGLNAGIIDNNIFSIMVIMVLFTTMITPLLLRLVFPKVEEELTEVPIFESVAHIEDTEDNER